MNTIPEKLPDDMAIWRFGVISPLLHRHPEGNSLSEELQCIAAKTFLLPNGQQRRFSSDTLRHWLYRYRKDGLAGLKFKKYYFIKLIILSCSNFPLLLSLFPFALVTIPLIKK
jgi:hypothetical protein